MTLRSSALARATLGAALVLVAPLSAARATWDPAGTLLLPSTQWMSPVAACSDGANGAVLFFHELSSDQGPGVIKAIHVLGNGEVDAAWPAGGTMVCSVAVVRTVMGAVEDGAGGGYLWWKEGNALYLTWISPEGQVGAAWPRRGRLLGNPLPSSPRPATLADGAGGIYVVWSSGTVRGLHLGRDNRGAGGWPDTPVTLLSAAPQVVIWPGLAAAPGGAYVTAARWSADGSTPPAFLLRRLDADGTGAAGWPGAMELGEFSASAAVMTAGASLIGAAPAPDGGVYVFDVTPAADEGLASRLRRFAPDGGVTPGWSAAGIGWTEWAASTSGLNPEAAVRVTSVAGGVWTGTPTIPLHSPASIDFRWCSSAGALDGSPAVVASRRGLEVGRGPGDDVVVADYKPSGPGGPYDDVAYIRVRHAAPTQTLHDEYHSETIVTWYGDVAIASAGDGTLFFWSQNRERHGLFGRRCGADGATVGVGAGEPGVGLGGVKFVPGSGIRMAVAAPAGARLSVFDLAGRRVAGLRLDAGGDGVAEVTVPGTSALPAGLYFARLEGAGASAAARVVVAR